MNELAESKKAKEPEVVAEEEPPKKKRGRPPKTVPFYVNHFDE